MVDKPVSQQVGIHLPRVSSQGQIQLLESLILSEQDMHIADQYVEIIGTVKEDLTIRAHTHIGLGNNLGQCSLAICKYRAYKIYCRFESGQQCHRVFTFTYRAWCPQLEC